MLMENFLRSKELWCVIETTVAEPTAGMPEEQRTRLEALKLKDRNAKIYLFQAIERPILETILCKDSSKSIWDSMQKKYEGSTKTKRQQLQALRTEFETLRMKSGESVTEYLSRTTAIVNKMRNHGGKIEDTDVVEKVLRSMTPKFNFVVCSIEEANEVKMTPNRMFSLYLNNTTYSCFSTKVKDAAWLWHFRYGVCEECVVSKQHLNQFPQKGSWRASRPLELVHSDICGPINPSSNGVPLVDETEDDVPTVAHDNQQNETSFELPSESIIEPRPQRDRRRPAWMSDYEEFSNWDKFVPILNIKYQQIDDVVPPVVTFALGRKLKVTMKATNSYFIA
nr:uncharacterized protein LOC109151979 [Ipomoea trifida]